MIRLTPIGTVESPLTDLEAAPKQGDEGALDGIGVGDERIVIAAGGGGLLEAVNGTPIVDVKPVLGADPRDR